ncbi:MAG: inorganic diphosphatase [Deltaproteobacteria bacterium]|nr:MAG: inorganic diphosphatase [Deltaproteobacteria bacterium]
MARADLVHLSTWTKSGSVRVVVESPKGSAVKFDYDPDLDVFVYGKALPLGLTYPYCWGFLPGTCGDDGDPLDIFVLSDAPTFPGVVIECRLVGVLRLPERLRQEMEQFFLSTTFFTHKHATVQGWKGHKAAIKLVRKSQMT